MNRTMLKLTLLALLLTALPGCVESGQSPYYDDSYYGRPGYYGPGYNRRHGEPYYNQQDQYEQQRRRIEANCNMNWQNCAGVCNTIAEPHQRAACIANCNNALNQCKNR
ncbi:hypothetical protein [Fundidesulfovibrio terrae]|uniref:hypothetical protein n=1 Tax=Fundidesulfovibrio terrae TaxID=2922866 RepID=UPI001FAF9B82|nr:hypothetical protein [Fundidesulfovibrio terrae]